MRTFRCTCGERVFFDNSRCLRCGRELGFVLEQRTMLGLEPGSGGAHAADGGRYLKCSNYVNEGVCNWLVREDAETPFCVACRLNNVIPDLSRPESRVLWAEMERAKRRVVYTLAELGLPLISKATDPERGLAFDIKADQPGARVLTGHSEGLITLNLGEADAVTREAQRVAMHERYRTLLGHFRHEVGHYFWEQKVRDAGRLAEFRELFGDERQDYRASLEAHYARDQKAAYDARYISAYAAAHPWEDWAETFAHYLHMLDTLDTAREFGFTDAPPVRAAAAPVGDIGVMLDAWQQLTVALNALGRSMGVRDPYPFAISPLVGQKLRKVHELLSAG